MPRVRPFVVREDEPPIESWDDPGRGPVVWRTLVSGDRTPSDSLTVGITEVPPGEPAAPAAHRHAQAEVYHVLAGEGVVIVDGREHPVAPGATVFVPGGATHEARARGDRPLRILYVFAADSFAEIAYEFE